jgi:hypothetical protein
MNWTGFRKKGISPIIEISEHLGKCRKFEKDPDYGAFRRITGEMPKADSR